MSQEKGWSSALWEGLLTMLLAAVLLGSILSGLWLYAGTWPPLSVVESQSMQHGDDSHLGVIDTGDMVIVQTSNGWDVVSYVEGSKSGHRSFGDYGDVIIYRPLGSHDATPIIHRPIIWLEWNDSKWDAPSLEGYNGSWEVSYGDGWRAMSGMLVLRDVGYAALTVKVDLGSLSPFSGFITLGDYNWMDVLGERVGNHDQTGGSCSSGSLVRPDWVKSKAKVEIPWVGSLKLLMNSSGSPVHVKSLVCLTLSILFLLSLPFVFERVWTWLQKRQDL